MTGGTRVRVRVFATVREAVGERELTLVVDDATVGGVLAALEADYPDLRGTLLDGESVADTVTVLRNGRNVASRDGAETPLAAGDRVSVSPPVTGG